MSDLSLGSAVIDPLTGQPVRPLGPDGSWLEPPGVTGLPAMSGSHILQAGGGLQTSPLAAVPTGSTMTWEEAKPYILKYESGGRNVMQGVVPTSISTAQGLYQITDSTWKDWAPQAGVDIEKYPTAMSAPPEVQESVAKWGYEKHGWSPWAPYDPRLAQAIGWKGQGAPSLAVAASPAPQTAQAAPSLAQGAKQPSPQAIGQSLQVQSPWMKLMTLSMIQQLTSQGTHQFTPVDYNPWAAVPQGQATPMRVIVGSKGEPIGYV